MRTRHPPRARCTKTNKAMALSFDQIHDERTNKTDPDVCKPAFLRVCTITDYDSIHSFSSLSFISYYIKNRPAFDFWHTTHTLPPGTVHQFMTATTIFYFSFITRQPGIHIFSFFLREQPWSRVRDRGPGGIYGKVLSGCKKNPHLRKGKGQGKGREDT